MGFYAVSISLFLILIFSYFFLFYIFSTSKIVHLEDGAHFGEVALVTNNAMRIASVIAVETCELYRLDRKDFIKAIFPYPDLYEKVKRIAGDRSEVTNLLDDRSMTAFYT